VGWHLTSVKAERIARHGLLMNPARKLHEWCRPGVYVWTDLDWAMWWAGARDGSGGRYARLVEVDLTGLAVEADAEGQEWFRLASAPVLTIERLLAGERETPPERVDWPALRICQDVAPRSIIAVHSILGAWPFAASCPAPTDLRARSDARCVASDARR
jgi:hypothetical protein